MALHNENFLKYGEKTFFDPKYVDTHLIKEGVQQSLQFGKTWQNIDDIELVLVSPLYRTLETAANIFKDKDVPIISLEELREYPIGRHTCNKRSSRDILIYDFPYINFDDIKGEEHLWKSDKGEDNVQSASEMELLILAVGQIPTYVRELHSELKSDPIFRGEIENLGRKWSAHEAGLNPSNRTRRWVNLETIASNWFQNAGVSERMREWSEEVHDMDIAGPFIEFCKTNNIH